MSNGTYLPEKVRQQIAKAGLPQSGAHPFQPSLARNSKGDRIIEKAVVKKGPRKGKKGFVDATGNIWIKDRAHAGYPDHWDV